MSRGVLVSHHKRPQIGTYAVSPMTTSVFDLPDRLVAKADPALIAGDERHFTAMAESLERLFAELSVSRLSGPVEHSRRG